LALRLFYGLSANGIDYRRTVGIFLAQEMVVKS
jgi:hypothetical protein